MNAPAIAEERGIAVSETSTAQARDFTDLVRVSVISGESARAWSAPPSGACTGRTCSRPGARASTSSSSATWAVFRYEPPDRQGRGGERPRKKPKKNSERGGGGGKACKRPTSGGRAPALAPQGGGATRGTAHTRAPRDRGGWHPARPPAGWRPPGGRARARPGRRGPAREGPGREPPGARRGDGGPAGPGCAGRPRRAERTTRGSERSGLLPVLRHRAGLPFARGAHPTGARGGASGATGPAVSAGMWDGQRPSPNGGAPSPTSLSAARRGSARPA